jgi:hypothetical protein
MAKLLPDLAPPVAWTAGQYVERQLLGALARGLPAAYTLYHDVDWGAPHAGRERHGQVDIVVVNRTGDVLLVEVKAGAVEFGPHGLVKRHGATRRQLDAQVRGRFAALKARLAEADLAVHLAHLLVLTHLSVEAGTAQWPRERIVDSHELGALPARVMALLPPGPEAPLAGRVRHFFEQRFLVARDVATLLHRQDHATARLAPGLATWATRIAAPSGVLRVDGAAGSGKSQLALRMLEDAEAAGQRGAYICCHRALADHVARIAPARTQVQTFLDLAQQVCRAVARVPDLNEAGAPEAITAQAIALLQARAPDIDFLVVDELQDFQPAWIEALLWRLRSQGRALLLEDRDQRLHDERPPFEVPEAVGVDCADDFRSPRALVRTINALRLASREIDARGAVEGDAPEPIVCDGVQGFERGTIRAVERCLARGFALADIVVLCLHGEPPRGPEFLHGRDRLGPWTLKRFTGRVDEAGHPVWTEGALRVDTVRRFKGQSAPAVVLTECDLPALRPLERRLLYVGLTRARQHLEWVMSAATNAALHARLAL